MVSLTSLRRSLIILTVPIFAISVTVLGLISNNVAYAMSTTRSTTAQSNLSQPSAVLLLPSDLRLGSTWTLFADGLGGTIDSILIFGLCYWDHSWHTGGHRIWYPLVYFIAAFSVVRSLLALIYGFIEFNLSSTFVLSMILNGEYPADAGWFTLESWNCQLRHVLADGGDTQESLCRQVQTSRGLSVPLAIMYIAVLVLVHVMWRTERRLNHQQRQSEFGKVLSP